jgi:hypothetical protein
VEKRPGKIWPLASLTVATRMTLCSCSVLATRPQDSRLLAGYHSAASSKERMGGAATGPSINTFRANDLAASRARLRFPRRRLYLLRHPFASSANSRTLMSRESSPLKGTS